MKTNRVRLENAGRNARTKVPRPSPSDYLVDQDVGVTIAYEYILEKPNGDLMTLAQKQEQSFEIGTHVLILYGVKARVILDNTDIKTLKQ